MKSIKDAKTFDEFLDIKYGKLGTPKRDEFENKAKYFIDKEIINDVVKKFQLMQQGLVKELKAKNLKAKRIPKTTNKTERNS